MSRSMNPAVFARALALAVALGALTSWGCAGASKSQAADAKSAESSAECKSCLRMCEVGGDAQGKPDKIDACKKRCARRCE